METFLLAETDTVVNAHSGFWYLVAGVWSLVKSDEIANYRQLLFCKILCIK
jgi:hypothetical protein